MLERYLPYTMKIINFAPKLNYNNAIISIYKHGISK